MKQINPSKMLYEFSDFRSYLLAYHEDMKKYHQKWSLGLWAHKMNLSSTSVLTNVLNGKRNPGKKLTEIFIQYFKFEENETSYFKDLIQIHKFANNPKLAKLFLDKVLDQRNDNNIFKYLTEKEFSLISKPLYVAIREFVQLKTFREDSNWIIKMLNFKSTHKEINKAISDLLELGLLSRDLNGKLQYSNGNISSTTNIKNEAVRRFHEEALELAKLSIRNEDIENRDITGITIPIAKKDLDECKKYLEACREDFMKKFEKPCEADQIIHLEIALFPFTKQIQNREAGK